VAELPTELPLVDPSASYWGRAGRLRSRVLAAGRKARLAGSLIAQSCLDHRVALIARDRDFRHVARITRLEPSA
jgi:predicted nucleic acid-binding protein